ncbi:MAG: hypothetical protein E7062_04580 [Spirochaetaceae bacterium]|nr:hypothetical protein [Spirochaetaceae bacterium]
MKKTFFALIFLCVTLLTSCSFWLESVTATVTVINETDQTWYYLAYYNGYINEDTTGVRSIEPHSQFTFETVEGWYTKADLQKKDDYFNFYHCDETAWETSFKERYEEDLNSDMGIWLANYNFAGEASNIEENGKQSQNYTVRIYPSPLDDGNTRIEVSWK